MASCIIDTFIIAWTLPSDFCKDKKFENDAPYETKTE
jgi:hypothetical protein